MRRVSCLIRHNWVARGETPYYETLEDIAVKEYVECGRCSTRKVRTAYRERPRRWEDMGILPPDIRPTQAKGESK